MKIVLFGATNRGSMVLRKLIELKHDVAAVFYFIEDSHEKIWYERIQHIAKEKGISAYNYTIEKKEGVTRILKQIKPDLMLCVSWRYMIGKEQYTIPIKGCIIFHDSLLPKYRGFAPMNWAIINGEKKTGVTMFYIADDVDSGDIVDQKAADIDILDNAKTVDNKITSIYLQLLEKNLPLIATGKSKRIPQDHSKATFTCKRTPEDGLINWNKTAKQIYDLIRGLTDPYPGAFTFVEEGSCTRKVYIWKASLDNQNRSYIGCIPGRIIDVLKGKGVKVLTAEGALIIENISFDNNPEIIRADTVFKSIKTTFRTNVFQPFKIIRKD